MKTSYSEVHYRTIAHMSVRTKSSEVLMRQITSYLRLPTRWARGSGPRFSITFSASYNRLPFAMAARLLQRFPRLLLVCHLYSQFLASGSDYEPWKQGNLTACEATEVLSSEGIAAHFSGPSPQSLSSTTRSSLASVWIRRSSLATPVATSSSSSLILATSPGRISRSTRSRTPRSTQRPLTLLRSRGDGGDGVLTGATRRLRSVRFSVHSFPVNLLLV